jgi:hypothetical protein
MIVDKLINNILQKDSHPDTTIMILFARVRQLMQQDG